jgi:hypothetical protein
MEKCSIKASTLSCAKVVNNMIISNIIGGLGNQMFQYAAGRAISIKNKTTLRMDISAFDSYKLRNWADFDQIFNCKVELADESDIRNVLGWSSPKVLQSLLSRKHLKLLRKKEFFVEPHFEYWNGINGLKDNGYLLGYWQSERYFLDCATQIREDLTFRNPLTGKNKITGDNISAVNSVSIHVRRGDYISDAKANSVYEACSIDYYRDAINYFECRTINPIFFIFSDDINWAKSNLPINSPHFYVDHNDSSTSYIDMHLMSKCKNNIIANSSFSWWGAWLNSNIDKVIVAPSKWFRKNNNTIDLMPNSWVRL